MRRTCRLHTGRPQAQPRAWTRDLIAACIKPNNWVIMLPQFVHKHKAWLNCSVLFKNDFRETERFGNLECSPSSIKQTPKNKTQKHLLSFWSYVTSSVDTGRFLDGSHNWSPNVATNEQNSLMPMLMTLNRKRTCSAHTQTHSRAGSLTCWESICFASAKV